MAARPVLETLDEEEDDERKWNIVLEVEAKRRGKSERVEEG